MHNRCRNTEEDYNIILKLKQDTSTSEPHLTKACVIDTLTNQNMCDKAIQFRLFGNTILLTMYTSIILSRVFSAKGCGVCQAL